MVTPPESPSNLKQRLKASYDAMADKYNIWTRTHDTKRHAYLDELCARVPKLGSAPVAILELGCGAGVPALSCLLSRNAALTAVANDLSETQLNLARGNLAVYGDRVQFSSGDMMNLKFDDASLTAVVALYSLIHLPCSQQMEMLRSIARWLEPGGCLLANFGAEADSGTVMERWLDDKGWMYLSSFGAEGVVDRLTSLGFAVETKTIEQDPAEAFVWVIARKL